MSRSRKTLVLAALIVVMAPAPLRAQEAPVGEGFRTRGLLGGWAIVGVRSLVRR